MAKEKELTLPERAKEVLSLYQDNESDNIQRAGEAIDFRAGEQWPQAIKQDREDSSQDGGSRPCPVLDKTNQYVRQIINEERQSRAAIKIRPVDDIADPKVAEVFNGIIRHIEDQSEAIEAYTTAGEHAIDGGFGFFRLLTEYEDPMSFDQAIRIKRIPNRFSVALGPHIEQDGSDLEEAVIWEDMPEKEFKRKWPKADLDSFDADDSWKSKDTVRVAEYMYIEKVPIKIYQLEDGSVTTELKKGEKPIDERDSVRNTVKWAKVTGDEVLEEKDMLGSYIPVVKVIGNELTMKDGKTRLSGAIETMMDPQRLHNYAHAGFIESVALAPRAPWLAEESQVEGYEAAYSEANRRNITLLQYKATVSESGQPIPPPQRTPPAGIPTGWDRMIQHTSQSIEGAAGMYGPSVGAVSQEKSGIALQEQKAQGMVGSYHFPDNLSRSIQQCGRILLEWIPKIYDTERVARMLGEDGDQDMAYLNPEQEQAVMPRTDEMGQEVGTIYNLNVGKYDVTVTTGPSYTAKRQEALENQMQVVNARPELLNVIGDIMFKNMDAPGSDDIAERLKTMLPPEIQQLEANKDQTPIDPRVQMAMQQIEQQAQMLEERGAQLQEFEAKINEAAQEAGADKAAVEAAKKELSAERKVFMADAKTENMRLELNARKIMEEIETQTGEKPDPAIIKIAQDALQHDREMRLKEYEAKLERDEDGDVVDVNGQAIAGMIDSLSVLGGQLQNVSTQISAPRQLSIKRDSEGSVQSVNGQPVIRDENGDLIGVQG